MAELEWGAFLPTFNASSPLDIPSLRRMAQTADAGGLDYVFVGDHLIWHSGILAPMPTLAHLAAVTRRVRLGPGVYLLPLRHPVITAKDVATLDVLSGGRVVMGVGAGGENPDEYRAAGLEPGSRGTRMDEALSAVISLLNGEGRAFDGQHVTMPGVTIEPRPAHRVPIWVGGRADAAADRAAAMADGWFPVWVSPERYHAVRSRVLERRDPSTFDFALNIFTAVAETRDDAREIARHHMENTYALPFERFERYVAYGDPDAIREMVRRYTDAGVNKVVFNLTGPDPQRQLHLILREVLDGGSPLPGSLLDD